LFSSGGDAAAEGGRRVSLVKRLGVEGQARAAKAWLAVSLVALAVGAGWSAWQLAPARGLNRESVWLLQASEQRAAYYQAWVRPSKAQGVDIQDPKVIDAAFGPHGALPPLVPALVASAKAFAKPQTPTVQLARGVNAVGFGLFVLLVGWMGLEAGGAIGALAAAAGAATIPRLLGVATVPDFGMWALLTLTLAAYLLHRANRSAWATLGAAAALAAAIHGAVVIAFFVFLPWLFITLGRQGVGERGDGYAATPPVPLRLVWVIPAAVGVGLWAYPFLRHTFKDHFHLWMTHFLRQPADPFLFGGEVWGIKRLPWYGGAATLLMTMPPTWLLLALVGWRGGALYERLMRVRGLGVLRYLPFAPHRLPDEADSHHGPGSAPVEQRGQLLRLARGMLIFFLVLPMLLRSPSFGGVDLVALAVPWLLVYAASGLARLAPVLVDLIPARGGMGWHWLRAGVATAFAWLMVAPAALESVRYHPLYEAYASWMVGGPQGARALGVSRYARGPLPTALLEEVAARSGQRGVTTVDFLLSGQGYEQVLGMLSAQRQLSAPMAAVHSDVGAGVVLLAHDDTDPGYGDALQSFYQTFHYARGQEMTLIVYARDAVPIFSALVLGGAGAEKEAVKVEPVKGESAQAEAVEGEPVSIERPKGKDL
jgi:hypothetical protein